MKIVNNTKLGYKTIGNIIDHIIDMDNGDTHYYGQVKFATCELENDTVLRIQIRYLKKYVEWRFDYAQKM